MFNTERRLTPSWDFVRPSVDLLRKNHEAVVFIVLLPALLASFGVLTRASYPALGLIALLVGGVWRLINVPVSYYLQLQAVKNKQPSTQECYQRGLRFWPRVIAFEIMFVIMLLVGFICLIVPGLIVFRRYFLTPYYIVSGNMEIGPAMKKSAEQTKPVSGYVWGTFGVMIVFTLIASLLTSIRYIGPILGALVSLIYLFGPVLRWREVSQSAGKKSK